MAKFFGWSCDRYCPTETFSIFQSDFVAIYYWALKKWKSKEKNANHKDRNKKIKMQKTTIRTYIYIKHKSDTELSNEFWKIKENKRSTNITWEMLGRHQAYNTSSKRCSLYLNENLKIALHRDNNMLNRQTEILSKCRHKNKYALISYDSKD